MAAVDLPQPILPYIYRLSWAMQQLIGFGPPRVLTNARVFGGKVKLKYLLHSGAQASEEAYFTFIPLVYDQPLVVIVLGPMP